MGFVGGCWGFFDLFFSVVVENCDALGLLIERRRINKE